MKEIAYVLFVGFWVFGLAVAKGFWMTTLCLIPLVAYVVGAQWIIERSGL